MSPPTKSGLPPNLVAQGNLYISARVGFVQGVDDAVDVAQVHVGFLSGLRVIDFAVSADALVYVGEAPVGLELLAANIVEPRLFGHSLGALISFELARELCRQYGVNPVSMFVSSSRAPQLSRPSLVIHTLPDKKFMAELRRLNGTSPEVLENDELMEIILPVLRADFALYENYVYEPDFRFDCPISAFGGLNDRRVTRCDLEGWQDQTSILFSLTMFPGDHFFVNTNEPLLLAALAHEMR